MTTQSAHNYFYKLKYFKLFYGIFRILLLIQNFVKKQLKRILWMAMMHSIESVNLIILSK